MICIEVREILIDYINHDLSAEENALVENHLQSCPDCYREYEFLKEMCICCKTPVEYQEIYVEEFVFQVRSRIKRQKRRKNVLRFVPLAAVPLAIVAFLILRQPKHERIPVYIDNETRVMIDSLSEAQFDLLIKKIKQVSFEE